MQQQASKIDNAFNQLKTTKFAVHMIVKQVHKGFTGIKNTLNEGSVSPGHVLLLQNKLLNITSKAS